MRNELMKSTMELKRDGMQRKDEGQKEKENVKKVSWWILRNVVTRYWKLTFFGSSIYLRFWVGSWSGVLILHISWWHFNFVRNSEVWHFRLINDYACDLSSELEWNFLMLMWRWSIENFNYFYQYKLQRSHTIDASKHAERGMEALKKLKEERRMKQIEKMRTVKRMEKAKQEAVKISAPSK